MIRYALRIDPRCDAYAEYGIRLLLDGLGVAGRRVEDAVDADLVYATERPRDLAERALWLRCADVGDWNASSASVSWLAEMPVLRGEGARGTGEPDPEHVAEDIVYSTYAAVTGVLERTSPRNAWGVPIGRSSVLSKSGALERPIVAMHCDYLASRLARRRQAELEHVQRWPDGKKYAVVLSHDVDKPFTRAPWSFYARRLRTNVSERAARAAIRGALQAGKVAAVTRFGRMKDPTRDPNFCFEHWTDLEASLPAASCFYVATTSSADKGASPDDVTYDFRHPAMVAQLRRAVDAGWEVGLHASINTRSAPGRVADERAQLEAVLDGSRVTGVRHHYWALEPELPERTLWHHVDAGLTYDSSLGLDDAPGFRRGMTWPFRPFDGERGKEVPILEVPPTLMDGAIFRSHVTAEEGRRRIEQHLEHVRRWGGAALLDWHLEQLNPARLHGAGQVLRSVLTDLASDSDVYWATPAQLADWWRNRRGRIEAPG